MLSRILCGHEPTSTFLLTQLQSKHHYACFGKPMPVQGENLSSEVKTYIGLLNRTNFALLGGLLSNWAFVLWVVHQLCFHDPLSRFNTSGKQNSQKRNKKVRMNDNEK